MKVEKTRTKWIKPHTRTRQNLKNYNISFVDKHLGPMNIAVILFYKSKLEVISLLEESLAKILVQFYPLAGRYIKNDDKVDCSDQGAEFVEAEALEVELVELVANSESEQLNALLPDQYFRLDETAEDPLLSIQATRFPCGGLAIAISVSHRVFDVASLGTFINAWSNATNPDNNKKVGFEFTPSFDLPSLLPHKDHDFGVSSKKSVVKDEAKIVVKRVVFNKVVLTSLKSRIKRENNGKPISGVRVVCAVIAQALIRLARVKYGRDTDFIIFQPVNMRERTIPSLPRHTCGNLSFASLTRRVTASEAMGIGIEELVDLIGEAVRKSIAHHAEILAPDRDGRDLIIENLENLMKLDARISETNLIIFTDWSRFGFYDANFGWGKPVWTSIGPHKPRNNATVLMSNKEGDGIEAWVHLNQNDMHYFEQDPEIKSLIT